MQKKRRHSGDNEQDGGLFALVGYLQQMLGGASDFVRCISPKRKAGPGEFQTLISFETEASGQDFVIEGVTFSRKAATNSHPV